MKSQLTKMLGALALVAFVVVSCNKEEIGVEQLAAPQVSSKLITYDSEVIPNQYIVVLKPDATKIDFRAMPNYEESQLAMKSEAISLMESHSLAAQKVKLTYSASIKGFMAELTKEEAVELAADPKIEYIEQDRIVRIGGGPPFGGGGSTSCQYEDSGETPWGITVVNGGATYTGSSVAWIIDTGIDLDHPDLNVDASRGFVASDMKGKDAGSPDDGNGHGTHCAGTVAAKADGAGVVGVAAGATVIPVKVLDKRGSGSFSGVIEGVDYVGANGQAGDVANMSLGGGFSQSVNDAVIAASSGGVWFAVAAGNDGADANNYSPASANGPYVRTISANDCNLEFASFSNYANPPVDFCAPGVDVKSTWKDGGYNTISGTSMAAPHAAGVLLASGGNPSTCGTVSGDPDGDADPIICN